MAKPTDLVEIGFDLTGNNVGPYFRLDDPIAGVLDNTQYILGGTIFFDVTQYVKSFNIRRGKSRQLDRYGTGQAAISFDNNARVFDPTYEDSPYYGQIIPRREIRITSGTAVQYFGSVDDWNLDYEPNGDNTAQAVCSDRFRVLANQTFGPLTNDVELSGSRVNTILDLEDVNWGTSRDIDAGRQTLGADTVDADTNVLTYLQTVEASEPGALFISKTGALTFRDRTVAPTSNTIALTDDGSGIPYHGMRVVYGSELLYNTIELTSVITAQTSTAANATSQGIYGQLVYSDDTLLINADTDVQELADWYAGLFANPEFRFESVEVILNELTEEQQNQILDLELGSVVKIVFTPGNPSIAPAIEKYAEIIRLDHSSDSIVHAVSIGFNTLDATPLVLDDLVFGKIGSGVLGF